VEWYCTEKIDVHGRNDLNWGAADNMLPLIARLNGLLQTHPAFSGASRLRLVTRGGGNTLAVARDGLLILANLDCEKPADVDWDRAMFTAPAAKDLVSGRTVDLAGPVALAPGEVLCLESEARNRAARESAPDPVGRPCLVHWLFPRDVKRVVVVPEEQWLEVRAPYHFRLQVVDPTTGKTLRAYRSRPLGDAHAVRFDAPHYKGNGTHGRSLDFEMTVYTPGRSTRTHSTLLIPPRSKDARVQLVMNGAEVLKHPDYRTILSNGAGATSQMRIGWGRIASQYDAILAANPNPDVPSDRVNLWARTRCWLQREGYMREFDAQCVTDVTADPAGLGARWDFLMPCGMGHTASFAFEVTLAAGQNAARLKVTRYARGDEDVGDQVRIVFRPDIEWRSYHAKTKAYSGLDRLFPARCRATADGFSFRPYDGEFAMSVRNGVYHHEPELQYAIAHPEEAARGQDGSGDLFSPGWISADLKVGETVELVGAYQLPTPNSQLSTPNYHWGMDTFTSVATVPVDVAMARALNLFIVKRDDLKTVIAGYPWFLDWGRDTFIFMRGMIAAGKVADAAKILAAFAAFEENGTLPNIIYGKNAGNRDTTDAQLWFVRCVQELLEALDVTFDGSTSVRPSAQAKYDRILAVCNSIVDNYIAGTPNGIHMDPDSGLIWSPSHFTWMDTNYPACTPRVGYPIEIQALWISALKALGRTELAERAKASVERYFKWEHGYRDCLDAPCGESAAQARPDDAIRPNQLFLITLGILDDRSILRATEELLVPGGIRSLNAGHRLYCGTYAGDEDTSRKPAYHNGTVWAWPFPLFAEALAMTKSCSREVARQLLASAVENINSGCLCHMSENADGDAPHAQKGCTAQAWSDSELLRVWLRLS